MLSIDGTIKSGVFFYMESIPCAAQALLPKISSKPIVFFP